MLCPLGTDCGAIDFKPQWGGFKLLLDPRFGQAKRAEFEARLRSVAPPGNGIWIASSGTTRKEGDGYTFLAIGEGALIASAEGVNTHLRAGKDDVFVSCLPDFHVGGLGLQVRAHLLGAQFVRSPGNNEPWNAAEFVGAVGRGGGTIVSLVPTQVNDLVRAGLKAPPSVRVAVVGGGAISRGEYRRGRALGWPLLPSYGSTECSSQVATASLESLRGESGDELPGLQILPHIEAKEVDGVLHLRSVALFMGTARLSDSAVTVQIRESGAWFKTSDRVALAGNTLTPLGRIDDYIKIGGEGVNLHELSLLVREIHAEIDLPGDAALRPVADERLGMVLSLEVTAEPLGKEIQSRFNARVLPFAKIRSVQTVSRIEKTALGKVKRT